MSVYKPTKKEIEAVNRGLLRDGAVLVAKYDKLRVINRILAEVLDGQRSTCRCPITEPCARCEMIRKTIQEGKQL